MMRYKEKWAVQIPANLAFGNAGRKASGGQAAHPRRRGPLLRDRLRRVPGFEGTYTS